MGNPKGEESSVKIRAIRRFCGLREFVFGILGDFVAWENLFLVYQEVRSEEGSDFWGSAGGEGLRLA